MKDLRVQNRKILGKPLLGVWQLINTDTASVAKKKAMNK